MLENIQDPVEPPADHIAPLGFKTADDAIKEIIQSDLSEIEGYAQMFECFRNDGFIYHFTDAENAVTLQEERTNAAVWLMPYDYFEDTGILYHVVYQGKDYQVYYYFTAPAFPASDLWDYMEQRLHTDQVKVVDGKYGIVHHPNGGQPVVSAYFAIDDTHYCKVKTYEPEDALMDFLQVLSYEKLDIAGNTSTDPITPVNEKQSITFVTYDAYREFLVQSNLPEGFVEYEQVKAIGSFNSLVFLSDARNADYSEYMYGFTESSKNTVFLTIVPSSKEKTSVISTPLSIDDINQSDMRFTKNKEVSGIFKIDDLSYKYIKGTLLSIMWEKNNLRYTLSCASTFSDYQLNMDSYVSKLLFYKSDVAERDTYSIAGKIFTYEKEGAGGYCTLSFNENGRFLYSPGKMSSYMGGGDWKTDGDIVSLIGMADKTIYLKITDDTLVYIAEGSDEFPYMDIKDGEKFVIYRPEISADKFQLNSRYSEYGLGDPKVELDLIVSELPEFCYVEDVRLYDEDDNFIGMMSPAMDADIWNYLVDCHVTEECSKTYYTLSKIRCGGKTYLDDVRSEITVNFKATPAP